MKSLIAIFALVLLMPGLTTCTLGPRPDPTATTMPAPSPQLQPSPTSIPDVTVTLTASPSPTRAPLTAMPSNTATSQANVAPSATMLTETGQISATYQLALEKVVDGLKQPVYVADAGDQSGRLFVVEKAGRIMIVRDGTLAQTPFVDLTDRVGSNGSEQGLLSVAFHPKFSENGYLFVNYTNKDGDTVISRLSSFSDTADPASELLILKVDQPYANHNGGLHMFGPDGFLYIGLGDGGSGGDPENRAQNPDELLGKILRIDINTGDPYTIPTDNPFVNGGGRPEIWALGLRNPWRFSFDRSTGDLYIGDVGQNKIEEIDFQPAGQGGQNYGWKQLEGSSCYVDNCDPGKFTPPVAEYPHEQGCSVTGGYVYRGQAFPVLDGVYFYGDYCSGTIWALSRDALDHWTSQVASESDVRISSFGEDRAGELYVTDIDSGVLYKIVANG